MELRPLTPPQGGKERSAPPPHATSEEAKQQREFRYCEFFKVLHGGKVCVDESLYVFHRISLLYSSDVYQSCG